MDNTGGCAIAALGLIDTLLSILETSSLVKDTLILLFSHYCFASKLSSVDHGKDVDGGKLVSPRDSKESIPPWFLIQQTVCHIG